MIVIITERQIKILKFYLKNDDKFISSQTIASYLNVSTQTIKNELKMLRQLSKDSSLFFMKSVTGRGTKFSVPDKKKLQEQLSTWETQQKTKIDNKKGRISLIIDFLLNHYGYISKRKLLEKFFISETTLYKDIKKIKSLLSQFGLNIEYKTNRGYRIIGSELNKRTYLTHLGIDNKKKKYNFIPENTTKIYNIAADTFINYKYNINEEILQNITAHISIALQRIKKNHYIDKINYNTHLSNTVEYKIAKDILTKTLVGYKISNKYFDNEVILLTQIILGKLNYINNSSLQERMNTFISKAFSAIYSKFSINFENVDNLKLLLVLHLVPLFYRVHSGTQLYNPLKSEIHKFFPQAYDISLYFSILLNKYCNLKISKDEVSFLALYFNYGIDNYLSSTASKKILIITSLRKSETILLRHKILNWFPDQIESISFIYPNQLNSNVNINKFDAIFTTENSLIKNQGEITYISLFPNETDYKKINLALNGFDNLNSILEKFNSNCFYYGKINSKKEALKIAMNNAVKTYNLSSEFVNSVKNREKLSSTYFSNKIAIPHTMSPVSEETFVSIVVLKNEIKWDKENYVNLIMLVSIAKNNPKEFQFWYYISELLRNEKLFQNFRNEPTFNNFINIVKGSLKNKFN